MKKLHFVLGLLLLIGGIALTALAITAEIGIPMAIAGVALLVGSKGSSHGK
jgi:hypothetical protein